MFFRRFAHTNRKDFTIAIACLTDEQTRTRLLEKAIANSLSLSQIRELVKAEQTRPPSNSQN